MKWLFYIVKILYGCRHKWKKHGDFIVTHWVDSQQTVRSPVICVKCGKQKSFKL